MSSVEDPDNKKKRVNITIRQMEIDDIATVFHLGEQLFTARYVPNLYRTWDDLGCRRSVSCDPYGFTDAYRPKPEKGPTKPLAVLDEIHRFPGWKRYLKGLWDTRGDRVDRGSSPVSLYHDTGWLPLF